MFIVIEGADGTGKSTLCPLLADALGAVAFRTPPEHYETSRDKIDRHASPAEKYDYYKAGVIEASHDIRRLVDDGKHVVVDRYWLTTIIYHEILGVQARRSDFRDIIEPDLTILLSLNAELQIPRMHSRGLTVRDQQMIDKQEAIAAAYYRTILKYKVPFVALDTGHLSSDQCVSVCVGIIRSLGL